MTRELTFNAWLPDFSYMLEDVAIGHGSICFPFIDEPEDGFYQFLKSKGFITPDEDKLPSWMYDTGEDWCSISEPTHFALLQYTGLKDKNGKKIFEGDIIPCKIGLRQYSGWNVGDPNASLNGVIEWNPYQACWHIKFNEKNKYDVISMQIGWGSNPEFEVIGNIHQNPELAV